MFVYVISSVSQGGGGFTSNLAYSSVPLNFDKNKFKPSNQDIVNFRYFYLLLRNQQTIVAIQTGQKLSSLARTFYAYARHFKDEGNSFVKPAKPKF